MKPSSRTPEGEPNRCPVCGGWMRLEPSQPTGDAPCPHCGCLIWFEQAAAERIETSEQASGEPIDWSDVEEKKQAILAWVRHIKDLSQSQVQPAEYFRELVEGLVSTLGARGGALWLRAHRRWKVGYHVGLESVGFSEKELREPPHIRLVDRVWATGVRCTVPPGSSGLAPQETNPTDSVLLLCPLTHAARIRGVVAIFPRSEEGRAAQGVYLRYLRRVCLVAGRSTVFGSPGKRPRWRRWR